MFGGEFQIQTGEIVLELRHLPSSKMDYWHRLMAQPGECDLRHAATGLFGNRLYSRYHPRRALFPLGIEGFHSLLSSARRRACLRRDISRLEIHRQGRESQNPKFQSFGHGIQFALDRPLNQAVLELQPDNRVQLRSSARVLPGRPQAGASEMPT